MQFHDFTIFRAKIQAKGDEEENVAEDKAQLADNPQIWNVHIVLNVLHSLVSKSNINDQLEVFKQGGDPRDAAGPFGSRLLYQMLGYFSLVGLLRLQSLLGRLEGERRGNAAFKMNAVFKATARCPPRGKHECR
jgi:translation initiation factor 3 subunit L